MYVRQRAPLRPHTTDLAHDCINRRTCLHIDVWLYESEDAQYCYVVQWSIAGKELIWCSGYTVMQNPQTGEYYLDTPFVIRDRAAFDRKYFPRYSDSPRQRQRTPYLEQLHRTAIIPLIWGPPPRFAEMVRGYRSIALHYIWTRKDISNPLEGVENTYMTTDRSLRDARYAGFLIPPTKPAKPERLPPRERSIMRTLDKILRN